MNSDGMQVTLRLAGSTVNDIGSSVNSDGMQVTLRLAGSTVNSDLMQVTLRWGPQ